MDIRAISAVILFLSVPAQSGAAALDTRTLDAWNDYIRQANSRMMERTRSHGQFLWIDEVPDRRLQVHSGQILVAPIGPNHPKRVPSGLIHDWIGAAFLPKVTLEDALAAVKDYSRYKEFYQPLIVDSEPLTREGAEYKFSIVIVNKTLFSRTALHSECRDSYFQIDARRWYSVGYSTSIQEIENYGQAAERELPPGEGSGYIWRLYTFSRFEERDGGVYVEREVIVLSRDIPGALRWLLGPIVEHLSSNSLSTSLLQTREAVLSNTELSQQCGATRDFPCHRPTAVASGQE
jgi:hypothetical protein